MSRISGRPINSDQLFMKKKFIDEELFLRSKDAVPKRTKPYKTFKCKGVIPAHVDKDYFQKNCKPYIKK